MSDNETLDWDDWGEQLNHAAKGKKLKRNADAMTASSMAGYAERVLKNDIQKAAPKKKRKGRVGVDGTLLESAIQHDIEKALRKVDGVTDVKRMNSGNSFRYDSSGKIIGVIRLHAKGTADLQCTYNGIVYALEVKRKEKDKASEAQYHYLINHAAGGGIAAVVRSVADALHVLAVGKAGEVVQW